MLFFEKKVLPDFQLKNRPPKAAVKFLMYSTPLRRAATARPCYSVPNTKNYLSLQKGVAEPL